VNDLVVIDLVEVLLDYEVIMRTTTEMNKRSEALLRASVHQHKEGLKGLGWSRTAQPAGGGDCDNNLKNRSSNGPGEAQN